MQSLTVDGRRVCWREAGDGRGVPLLLVHGWTGSSEDFAEVLDELGADRRVVAVDLPGHGGSEGPDDPDAYGLVPLACWVLRVIDELGLAEVHLLGHSLGGLVAQRIAYSASERLRGLLLMGTGLGAPPEDVVDPIVRVALVARDEGLAAAFAESQRLWAESALPPELLAARAADAERRKARYLALNPAAVVGGAAALVTATPLGAFLRGIDVPVLVVHGEHDYAWGLTHQRQLVAAVRGAQHAVIPDSYHSPQRENPSAWLRVVRDFLAAAERR